MNVGRVENLTKLLVFASLTVVLVSVVSAQNGNCKDGTDNDGVGPADGSDAGCAAPYFRDDSEEYVWDSDASSLFTSTGVQARGPTIFIPGRTFEAGGGINKEDDRNSLKERYIKNPGDDAGSFGEGELGTEQFSKTYDTRNTGFLGLFSPTEYVDPPRTGDCGDGVRQTGESPVNCPTDAGIKETVFNEERIMDSNNVSVREYGAGSYGQDVYNEDITSMQSDESKTFSARVKGEPDYFIDPNNNNRLEKINTTNSSSKILEVDNFKSSGTNTVLDWSHNFEYNQSCTSNSTAKCLQKNGNINLSCTPKDSNSTCVSETINVTSLTQKTKNTPSITSSTITKTVNVDSFHLRDPGNGVGYSIDNSTDQLTLEITANENTGSNTKTYKAPQGSGSIPTDKRYFCKELKTPTQGCKFDTSYTCNTTAGCNMVTKNTSSPEQKITYASPGQKYTKQFYLEEIGLREYEYFDTNINENNGPTNTKSRMFSSTYTLSNVSYYDNGTRGFYSIGPDTDNLRMGNNRAYGWTTFKLGLDGDNFALDRTEVRTYEADGDDGSGDGLVAFHKGTGIIGNTTDYGPYVTESQVESQISCPGGYTKCISYVDIALEPFKTWSSAKNPSSGINISVQEVGTGEGISACKIYQNLNGSINCTYANSQAPLPEGPYTDEPGEYQRFMKGPQISSTGSAGGNLADFPIVHEGRVQNQDNCVFNGTEYAEWDLVDIGKPVITEKTVGGNVVTKQSFEKPERSLDREVCIDGKWYDTDSSKANNIPSGKPGYMTHPDAPQANVITDGIALEEDCTGSDCSDTAYQQYVAPFKEGVPPADANPFMGRSGTNLTAWRNQNPVTDLLGNINGKVSGTAGSGTLNLKNGSAFPVSSYIQNAFDLELRHNTVQTRDNAGASSGTGQDEQGVSLSNKPLENSRIDPKDDEWGLTDNLQYGIANNGTGFKPGACYGTSRKQSIEEIDKEERVYANSYVRQAHVYEKEQSKCRQDGQWVNPDKTALTVQRGGMSCDLTGNDWGIAVDSSNVSGLNSSGCSKCSKPSADFTHKVRGPKLLTVDFNDTSIPNGGNINSWNWTIDGTTNTSQNLTYKFPSSGKYTVKLEVTKACGNTDIISKRIDLTIGEKLQEMGGEENGTIQKIEAKGSSPVGLVHRGGDICLGTGCPNTTGTPTPKDSDKFVNETGDVMSGSLHTARIYTNETYDICIGDTRLLGSLCPSVGPTGGPALGGSNVETRTGFSLRVNDIVPKSDDLRLQTQ